MPRYVPIGMALWILGTLGCATRGNVDVLESQLRKQEDQIFAIETQLSQSESELTLARREVQTLRVQLAERGKPTLLPEQSQLLHRLAGVRVQKYFSGGLDRDGVPGDDLLNVVVVPHDEDGETLKSPGELEIEAIDLSAPEGESQLGVWRFSSEEVAKHWHSGLTSGFQFRMPWQLPPASENVVLQARFRTLDGRQFGTSAEIRVTPNPEVVARAKNRRLANLAGESRKRSSAPFSDPISPVPLPIPEPEPDLNSPLVPAAGHANSSEPNGLFSILDERKHAPAPPANPSNEWPMPPGSKSDP